MHDHDHELEELLQEAVDAGLIEKGSGAYGSAMQCIYHGYESLNPEQKNAYDKHAAPHLEKIGAQREVQQRISGMPE